MMNAANINRKTYNVDALYYNSKIRFHDKSGSPWPGNAFSQDINKLFQLDCWKEIEIPKLTYEDIVKKLGFEFEFVEKEKEVSNNDCKDKYAYDKEIVRQNILDWMRDNFSDGEIDIPKDDIQLSKLSLDLALSTRCEDCVIQEYCKDSICICNCEDIIKKYILDNILIDEES